MKKIVDFLKKHGHKVLIILLCVILLFELWQLFKPNVATVDTAAVTDWGLGFQGKTGSEPTAPVDKATLNTLNAYYIGNTEEKTIYLTFDAGYENGYGDSVLDILKEKNVSAVFFLTGHYFKSAPDLVRRMATEGHTVGNHTATHPDMSKIKNLSDFRAELEEVERLYFEVTGEQMTRLYRPPQGKFDTDNLRQAQLLGYKTVFWSLAYADWDNANQPSQEAALDKLFSRLHQGAVILLHLTSKTNSEILGAFIDGCRERGYTFGNIDGLFA